MWGVGGGGYHGFVEEKNSVSKDGKTILFQTWAETNIQKALYALKNNVFVEKKNVFVIFFAAPQIEKKTRKTPI